MKNKLVSLRRLGVRITVVLAIVLIARLIAGNLALNAIQGDRYDDAGVFIVIYQACEITVLITALISTVSFVVFMFILVYWVVHWIVVSINATPAISETPMLSKLIGLAFVAAIFGNLFSQVYYVSRVLAIALFSDFTAALSSAFRNGMNCIESNTNQDRFFVDSTCISGSIAEAARTIRSVSIDLFGSSGIGLIDPIAVTGAIVVFLIATIISSKVRSDMETQEQFWLAYGCVAAFATYLTLSAILAVPLLSEDENDPRHTAAELKQTLEQMNPGTVFGPEISPDPTQTSSDSSLLNRSFEEVFSENQLRSITPLSDAEEDVIKASAEQKRLTQYFDQLSNLARGLDALGDQPRRQFELLEVAVKRSLTNDLNAAFLAYDSEISVRRGQREATRHFVDLRNWFQFRIEDGDERLQQCQSSIVRVDSVLEDSHSNIKRTLERSHDGTIDDAIRFLDIVERRLEDERGFINDNFRNTVQACADRFGSRSLPPSRAEYGSFLGIVGAAASWLLRTESMEVALLTGLIGFGLLGALVAQFVKSGGKQEFDMAQIAAVVFSGFCAAIVVYVGAYGGLTIVSMSGDDPNPYVVFMACLVGAVFSAEIWERAKKWLIS